MRTRRKPPISGRWAYRRTTAAGGTQAGQSGAIFTDLSVSEFLLVGAGFRPLGWCSAARSTMSGCRSGRWSKNQDLMSSPRRCTTPGSLR